MESSRAVNIWNRATADVPSTEPAEGDRALAAMLHAHGLIMNGGVINTVETMKGDELDAAIAGYVYFGLDSIAPLITRATMLLRESGSIGSQEESIDLEYYKLVPDDSLLFSIFEKRLFTNPHDFAPL